MRGGTIREYVSTARGFSRDAKLYLICTSLYSLMTGVQYLYLNLYALELGFDQAFIGTLVGIPAFVTAAVALPVGFLLPRFGYRRGLLLGISLQVTALLGGTLLPSPPFLLAASALWGLGSALTMITASPLMADVSGVKDRTHLFSIQFAAATLASVVASAVGGILPGLYHRLFGLPDSGPAPYRATLITAMVIASIALVPVIWMGRHRGRTKLSLRRGEIRPYRKPLLQLIAIQLTISCGAGLIMPFVNIFYRLEFGASDATLGTAFAASSLTIVFAGLMMPLLVKRFGSVWAIALTQFASLPFLLVMGFAPWLWISICGYLIRTALMNMSTPTFNALSMGVVPPSLRPLAASLVSLSWNGGWALSSFFSGHVQGRVGFSPLFLAMMAFYVVSPILVVVFFRHSSPAADDGTHPDPEHALADR